MKRTVTLLVLAAALTLGAHGSGLDQDAGSSISTGPGLFDPYVSLDTSDHQVLDMRKWTGGPWDEEICTASLVCHWEHHTYGGQNDAK